MTNRMHVVLMKNIGRLYCCSSCGCPDVEVQCWAHANAQVISCHESNRIFWCPRCEKESTEYCMIDPNNNVCTVHNVEPKARRADNSLTCPNVYWDWWKLVERGGITMSFCSNCDGFTREASGLCIRCEDAEEIKELQAQIDKMRAWLDEMCIGLLPRAEQPRMNKWRDKALEILEQ